MKTYYCVATTIRDDGHITINLIATQEAEQRPENKCTSTRRADYYTDWLDSAEEVLQYINENK